jgi:hypothetical protein
MLMPASSGKTNGEERSLCCREVPGGKECWPEMTKKMYGEGGKHRKKAVHPSEKKLLRRFNQP